MGGSKGDKGRFEREIRKIVLGSLGFLMSLAWRDVLFSLVQLKDLADNWGFEVQVVLFLVYALFVTVVVVGSIILWSPEEAG